MPTLSTSRPTGAAMGRTAELLAAAAVAMTFALGTMALPAGAEPLQPASAMPGNGAPTGDTHPGGAQGATAAATTPPEPEAARRASDPQRTVDGDSMGAFLDRLMQVESGGRDTAKNPRSTALGPFQFLETTFLDITRRYFQAETASLTQAQVLALRIDRAFSRRAAERLTRENAAQLAANGIAATFANLRLAYLVGPTGTVRLFKAEPGAAVIAILGAPVVQANPFMAGMAVRDLVAWSERNMRGGAPSAIAEAPPGSAAAALASRDAAPARAGSGLPIVPVKADAGPSKPAKPAKPAIRVECNLGLASCRRWLALAERAAVRRQVAAARPAPAVRRQVAR